MRLTQREAFLNSAALLAIHCAISYSDALRSGLGSEKLSSDDHRTAITDLERLIPAKWANSVGKELTIEGWRNGE